MLYISIVEKHGEVHQRKVKDNYIYYFVLFFLEKNELISQL